MPVVTILFLLAAFFPFLAICAPNQRADRFLNSLHAQVLSDSSTQSVGGAIIARHEPDAVPSAVTAAGGIGAQSITKSGSLSSSTGGPDLNSAGSSLQDPSTLGPSLYNTKNRSSVSTPNSNQPNQCRGVLSMPSGSCLPLYPSPGSNSSNSTSPFPGSGLGSSGRARFGTGCPPVQTVTLPPVTVTLPAQTITVTPSPVTTTITITPQTQTQTLTITVTISNGPAPPYPIITTTPGSGFISAPSSVALTSQVSPVSSVPGAAQGVAPIGVPLTGQNTPLPNSSPIGQLVPPSNILGTTQRVSQSNVANTAGLNTATVSSVTPISPGVSTQVGGTEANQLPNQTFAIRPATSSSSQFFSIPATLASELNAIPLFYPSPAYTPIPSRTGFQGGGTSASLSGPGSALSNTLNGQYPAPYQNGTGGLGLSIPSGSGIVPGVGPTSGPTAPAAPISASLYQIIGSFGNPSIVSSPKTGAVNPSNSTDTAPPVSPSPVQAPQELTGLSARPSASPIPGTNNTNAPVPPLPQSVPTAACSINHTSTQTITADVRNPAAFPPLPKNPQTSDIY